MDPIPLPTPARCPKCDQLMRPAVVKTAIWQGERLYMVEDIPAQICDSCLEQFYDEDITDALRRLTEDGFPAAKVKREILVPVFSLERAAMPVPAAV